MENFGIIIGILCLVIVVLIIYVTITISSLRRSIDNFIEKANTKWSGFDGRLKEIKDRIVDTNADVNTSYTNLNNTIYDNHKSVKDKLNTINNNVREFRIEITESIKKLHNKSKAKNSYKKKNDTTASEQNDNQ